ncbi:hypothetical protein D3C86_1929330 [compost metagenome]
MITEIIITVLSVVQFAITNNVIANNSNCTHMEDTVPKLFCSFGAVNTDVKASISPQPKKT